MLTGLEIIKEVFDGKIVVSPFDANRVGPNSYDLRLGPTLKMYNRAIGNMGGALDPKKVNTTTDIILNNNGYAIRPGVLYLGHTEEKAGSDHYIPCIEGRSSLARLGIQVHMTAGFGDIGFIGQWTLEIQAVHPVILYPRMRICQIYFQKPIGEIELYKGKYSESKGVIASKIYEDNDQNEWSSL